jgi:hypothetical protein
MVFVADYKASVVFAQDEAIERTFKTIAKHFAEVFMILVPGGKAKLAMETAGVSVTDEGGNHWIDHWGSVQTVVFLMVTFLSLSLSCDFLP